MPFITFKLRNLILFLELFHAYDTLLHALNLNLSENTPLQLSKNGAYIRYFLCNLYKSGRCRSSLNLLLCSLTSFSLRPKVELIKRNYLSLSCLWLVFSSLRASVSTTVTYPDTYYCQKCETYHCIAKKDDIAEC